MVYFALIQVKRINSVIQTIDTTENKLLQIFPHVRFHIVASRIIISGIEKQIVNMTTFLSFVIMRYKVTVIRGGILI